MTSRGPRSAGSALHAKAGPEIDRRSARLPTNDVGTGSVVPFRNASRDRVSWSCSVGVLMAEIAGEDTAATGLDAEPARFVRRWWQRRRLRLQFFFFYPPFPN